MQRVYEIVANDVSSTRISVYEANGVFKVFVGGFHQISKKTLKGAIGWADRCAAN